VKAQYRITYVLGVAAVLALGFAAGLNKASPSAGEGSASGQVTAVATHTWAAMDAALTHCDDACRQSRGIAAVRAVEHRPPP
jgi:hypothetical protein